MKLAAMMRADRSPEVVVDTLSSVRRWMTKDVMILLDPSGEIANQPIDFPAYVLEGFRHDDDAPSNYRSIALGLMKIQEIFPDADWYCVLDYDTLVASDYFKLDLKKAEKKNAWMAGNFLRRSKMKLPYLDKIIKQKIDEYVYLLGCCVFYKKEFLQLLSEKNFFHRFLVMTNDFSNGFFPDYRIGCGYDLSEHLYPTLASLYGGEVYELARWYELQYEWHGDYEHYPMRWRPELSPYTEHFLEASLLHPLKNYDHPIREYHRMKRTTHVNL